MESIGRVASLPMYNRSEISWALDSFWAALARRLRLAGLKGVPDKLTSDRPVNELWNDPKLLISQCCGHDVVHRYRDTLVPIATPEYSAPGCLAENYCSVVMVARDSAFQDVREMFGAVAAINGPESHSGMSTLLQLVAKHHVGGKFFSEVKVTGSHQSSLDLIRSRKAHVAAIDSVTLAHIRKYCPQALVGIRELGTTYRAPAPPFVVRSDLPAREAEMIRQSLFELFEDAALIGCRDALLLKRLVPATSDDYWIVGAYKDYAAKAGCETLQ